MLTIRLSYHINVISPEKPVFKSGFSFWICFIPHWNTKRNEQKRSLKLMTKDELRKKIISLLDSQKTGTLATVSNNRPYSRYMNFYHEGLTLYTATNSDTHKVEDIKANPNVHILLGYEGNGLGDAFLEIEGLADLSDSGELKQKLWKPDFDKWFTGPDDPNYIILKIVPEKIRFMNEGEPQEFRPGQ
jgi:general stress protein 26